jgi:tetraacyldisaccharide 4'-kinase
VLAADRAAAARQAIGEHGGQVILLDDGYQHRRLHRDLNIVLIDATEPYGWGHVFPRGTLREPLAGWSRADVAILTRSEQATSAERQAIRALLSRHAPHAAWVEASYVPRTLRAADGRQQPLAQLAGRPVSAFCGIGNPASFRRALEACGYLLAAWTEFPDHHAYTAADARRLAELAQSRGATAALCTHKDLVKIGPLWAGSAPLWAVESQLQILAGQAALESALHNVLALAAPS